MNSKEELGKIKKLIFIIGEILVAESKQDISPEEAIQRIRKTCNKYGINGTGYETIKQDLDRLEKLEKENQELKEKVNYFKKVIEVMQNPSKLDCTHMFDNCKKLTPLTEKKEEKKTSLEAFEEIIKICNLYHQQITNAGDIESVGGYPIKKIKKDLEIVECFRKIPKQDLKDFIESQLRYEKIIKNWLDERPFLYVDKEDPTKHLIKIKEWLEK